MEKIRLARIASRLLYVGAIAYYALHVYGVLQYSAVPRLPSLYIAYLIVGLCATAAFTIRLYWLPALTLLLVMALHPDAALIFYLAPILVLGVVSSHLQGEVQGDPLRALGGASAAAALYASLALLGFIIGYLLHGALAYNPPLTGDAALVYSAVSSTLAFKAIFSIIILAFAYKTISSLIELVIAYYSKGQARRALRGEILEKEMENIAGFKGSQYGVLEWGVSTLLTLLVAPLIYTTTSRFVKEATAPMGPQTLWVSLLALLLTTVFAWIPMRLLSVLLVRTPPIEYVVKRPSPAGLLAALALALAILLGVPALFGYDPLNTMVETLTGRPSTGNDPGAGLLSSPGEEYYRDLARLLDLLARLFWGG